jgi:hypothetical protein
MSKGDWGLSMVYRFSGAPVEEGRELPGNYQVLYFFSGSGPVGHDVMEQVCQELFQRPLGTQPIFRSLEELKDFALGVCQSLQSPEVSMLSVQDYNVGVEAAGDTRAFRELFRRYGLNIPNPDIISRTPGLLGRIFKK